MENKTPARLDWSAMVDSAVRCFPRLDVELPEQTTEADPRALMADADANRAVFIVGAHRDDGPLKPRIRHSRHRQQQFAREKARHIDHGWTMSRRSPCGKT
jgi:hypothetical protein